MHFTNCLKLPAKRSGEASKASKSHSLYTVWRPFGKPHRRPPRLRPRPVANLWIGTRPLSSSKTLVSACQGYRHPGRHRCEQKRVHNALGAPALETAARSRPEESENRCEIWQATQISRVLRCRASACGGAFMPLGRDSLMNVLLVLPVAFAES